ncbi:hypothetical protein HELRODRAFT_165707 [Helobdella robusta]|uniref:Uncharacterized protein n=1 Tax=Helobdella robusta TaxID=6412 RepID=T1EX72_HELRO|nr:hypothetical protein HELRODRAFT_165707 [Helobdella robusta]ESN91654.1 hypothetical protein HELRODRAFT_165707 [Helobdella robusta]
MQATDKVRNNKGSKLKVISKLHCYIQPTTNSNFFEINKRVAKVFCTTDFAPDSSRVLTWLPAVCASIGRHAYLFQTDLHFYASFDFVCFPLGPTEALIYIYQVGRLILECTLLIILKQKHVNMSTRAMRFQTTVADKKFSKLCGRFEPFFFYSTHLLSRLAVTVKPWCSRDMFPSNFMKWSNIVTNF